MKPVNWKTIEIKRLLHEYPFVTDFLDGLGITPPASDLTMQTWIGNWSQDDLEDLGYSVDALLESFCAFMEHMALVRTENGVRVHELTIRGGWNKAGEPENIDLILRPGQVISIVGPTGSGKSRLLADIEWMAQGDTPTGRSILLDGKQPPSSWRFSPEHKLVAQLSQNMNFVMDLTAE